ncbi:TonB-dependent receptor [Novosphingobium sp.]|uniref:TonB-dependent receptor n=1 Tax=Novosphingobium sp. TaxID=1874826 RepID=UPI00260651E8|nr:TonB-dependent receptor [Novosphingobium sp.]
MNRKFLTFPHRFLLASALIPAATLLAEPALAQDAGEKDAEDETIVVTGYKAAARAAIEAKRNAQVVIDSISQDDIGRLPDLNIVESARRITGLSTVGGLDPTKNRDIYQRVTIRGLDPRYNLITVDGVPLASSEWTVRGARLEQFPNSLVSRIEAIKTITAQYDPHGLGGQLNIVSRSAFDAPSGQFIVTNASIGQNTSAGDFLAKSQPNVRIDATGSFVFGADNNFGLTVSAEYQKLYSSAFSELPGDTNGNGWTYYTAAGAQTPFPSLSRDNTLTAVRPQDFRFDNERSRIGLNGKLEYAFGTASQISLFAGYYRDEDQEFRAEVLTGPGGVPTNVTATSGTFPSGNLQQGIVEQPQVRETYLVTTKGNFGLTDNLVLNLTGSYSQASYDEQRIFHKWATSVIPGRVSTQNTAPFGYSYTLTGGSPRATHNERDRGTDPANYQVLYVRDIFRLADAQLYYGSAELAWNAAPSNRGIGVRAGIALTTNIQELDVRYTELTAANAAAQAQIGGLGNFIFDARPPSRNHVITPYLVINPQSVLDFVAANPTLFVETNQRANNFADDFRDKETILAPYLQGLWRTDNFTLTAGVRYDKTDIDIDTFQVPTTAGATEYEPFSRASSYDFLLPSVLATYNFTEDMRITAGFSKTIGRPDFAQYAARTTYSIGSLPGTLTINTGNPDLQPREALNYDLSFEYYMPNGLLSVAVFQKDIRNEIFNGTQAGEPTTFQGVLYPDVTINAPLNSGKAKIKGLEIGYTQDSFGFLPKWLAGLGLNANFTLLDGSFDLPMSRSAITQGAAPIRQTSGLIQQPEYIANLTAFYNNGPVEARVSYNRIGRALQQANQDTPERDLFQEPRSQLDVQLRVALKKNFDVVFQGQNITKEQFIVRQGPGRAYLNNAFPVGAIYWLGVSWRP